jgi:hypothetical protein
MACAGGVSPTEDAADSFPFLLACVIHENYVERATLECDLAVGDLSHRRGDIPTTK